MLVHVNAIIIITTGVNPIIVITGMIIILSISIEGLTRTRILCLLTDEPILCVG